MATPIARVEKRDRIIAAAISVFAEKGFHAARISDIADKAGVADGTIYLYFRHKEDILLVIFEEKMDELLADLAVALRGLTDPPARIRAFARHHVEQLLREYRPEKLWAYLDVFGKLVEEGQASGVFRADLDPFVVKWAFFGALDELSIQWVLSRKRDRFNLERAADQTAEVILRGMSADVGPSHP